MSLNKKYDIKKTHKLSLEYVSTDKCMDIAKLALSCLDKNTGNKTYEHDKTSPPCKVKLFHRHYAKSQGYAFVSLQCLPLSRATTLRAGQGRSEPNENVVGKCDVPGETVFCCIKNRWIQGLRSTFEFYRFIYRKEIKYAILAVVLVILLLISLAVVFSS